MFALPIYCLAHSIDFVNSVLKLNFSYAQLSFQVWPGVNAQTTFPVQFARQGTLKPPVCLFSVIVKKLSEIWLCLKMFVIL